MSEVDDALSGFGWIRESVWWVLYESLMKV